MKSCPSCNSRIDDQVVVCPHCGHDFENPHPQPLSNRTMMGFPALSSITAGLPDESVDPAKQTLFGFPAQKAAAFTSPSLQEDSEPDLYDEGEATSLIPAAQLQKEFEAQGSAPAHVEAHTPRATVAGVPASELSKAPANIKSAWGLDDDDDDFNSESTSMISAGAIFDKEQEAKGGFSKRVENSDFPTSSTLMGMSITDFEKGVRPEDNSRSTQFAMPAVQLSEPVKPAAKPPAPHQSKDFMSSVPDDGPESGDMSTQMWNPADDAAAGDQAEHRAFLEKLRAGEDDGKSTRMGMPAITATRTTAENAKPAATSAPQGPQVGKAPALPAPSTSNTDSLRQRLQDRLKSGVPSPLTAPAATAKPAEKPAEKPFEKAVIDLSDLAVEPLKPKATAKPAPAELPDIAFEPIEPVTPEVKAPRSLASSGVLGKHTYVVSKSDEPSAPKPAPIGRIVDRPATAQAPAVPQPEPAPVSVATKAPTPLFEEDDEDDFAYADTGIASADLLSKINAPPKSAPTPISADADPFAAAVPQKQPETSPAPFAAAQPTSANPAAIPSPVYQIPEDPTDPHFPPSYQSPQQEDPYVAQAPQAAPAVTAGMSTPAVPHHPEPAPPAEAATVGDPLVARFQSLFALLGTVLLLVGAALAGLDNNLPVAGGLGLLAVILAAVTFALPQGKRGIVWLGLGLVISAIGAVILVLNLSVLAGACAIGAGFAAMAGFVLGKLLG